MRVLFDACLRIQPGSARNAREVYRRSANARQPL